MGEMIGCMKSSEGVILRRLIDWQLWGEFGLNWF